MGTIESLPGPEDRPQVLCPPPSARALPGSAPPEPDGRKRITFDVDDELHEAARLEAARSDQSLATLARESLSALLDQRQREKDVAKADFAVPSRDTKAKKQERFLKAVERRFWTRASCRLANVSRADVRAWMEDEVFQDRLVESQECFVEASEQKLLHMGTGKIKGNFMALIAFLNAHHPQYGRMKVEILSQVFGQFLDRIRKHIMRLAGEKLGDKINKALDEEAERQMARFSE